MTSVKEQAPVKTACIFGAERTLPLLDAFLNEVDGVRSGRDIEHIHRMRVASRRLRAALPLFESCFPPEKFHKWMAGLQKITRALGDARDTDVQIAFLLRLREKRVRKNTVPSDGEIRMETPSAGIATLLLGQLQKRRKKYQNAVLSALENLEKSEIPDEIRTGCTDLLARGRDGPKQRSLQGIPAVAAGRISRRLNALLQFEHWVYNPDAVTEHHAMRIAAKKLRYTMEVYAPVYRRNLKKPLVRVKKIQQILGDLHDCDVWIDTVLAMLLNERSSSRTGRNPPYAQYTRVTGYRHFLAEREKERNQIYRTFVRYWESVGRAGLWEELRSTLNDGRKERFRLSGISGPDAVRSSLATLSAQYPEGMAHSRTVTTLALQIFDDLAPFHRMHAHDRCLLECASSLHDIGLQYGSKRHAHRSEELILSEDALPVDIIDRGMIALVSSAHRGKIRLESDGFFPLLTKEQQQTVLMLASMLRVADGLDWLRTGSITAVHCTAGPQGVVIETSAIRDVSEEIERALKKGDLFRQVFEQNLVIR
jgi:CHAD domain-containing protein